MDPREMETLVQRLVQNPHDQEAITYAHHAGQSDPRSYAMLLEKVGTATSDPAFASHWLTEAANVWSTTLGDAHRAARALMIAIDRDPTQPTPAERLADLYRDKGDTKALVALLERRGKALAPLSGQDSQMRAYLAGIHEELGRLWSEAPLTQPKKAIENYRRAIDYDPASQYAIYGIRELHKSQGQWAEAVPYFAMEVQLTQDTERQIALYQDEAEVRKSAGDLVGATQALRHARRVEGGADPTLKQMVATAVLERARAGERLPPADASEAAQLFTELAEEYPGEHGFSYATCALEVEPGNDRSIQLAMYYAGQLGRDAEAGPYAAAYMKANPEGALAAEARELVGRAMAAGATDESLLEALAPAPGAASPERARALADIAEALARKGKKNEAAAKYREVLEVDPANVEAVGYLENHLRQTRKYQDLRDILLAATRSPDADEDTKKGWLREIAGLCETQLRDLDSAIYAWQQLLALDRSDDAARTQLRRLLERGGRWDDLTTLLEQEAEQTTDIEARISLEKHLAKIHEQKRKDPVATGEAWARIANLTPDDEVAISTAVRHLEKGQRYDLASAVIADNIGSVADDRARGLLFKKLGELREAAGELGAAGEAFTEGAGILKDAALWEAAERCFVSAQSWEQAAMAVDERARLAAKPAEQAAFYAREAEHLGKAGDEPSSILRLEQATDLDPLNEQYAKDLEQRFETAERISDLATFLLRRAEKLPDKAQRVALRKRAAELQRERIGDADAARESLMQVLADGDDAGALGVLADDADERGEHAQAVELIDRLAKVTPDRAERAKVMLRAARLVAEGLEDGEGAIDRYEAVLKQIDPRNEEALEQIASLQDIRGDSKGAADALERHLKVAEQPEKRLEIAQRLANLYEGPLDDPRSAVRVLDVVRELDTEDFEALNRLCMLCEKIEDWPRVAELTAALIQVEGDDAEVSRMTRRLAEILNEKVGKGDEALAALLEVADQGDEACREYYVELGDQLGWKGIVATKLVEWYLEAGVGEKRNEALRGAFERFIEVGRDGDAANVARELIRSRGADADVARRLEGIAVKLKDLDALGGAHDLMVQELSGRSRAEEMVRQAEVMVEAGVDPAEAIVHGEQALTSVAPDEVEPLLERLGTLATGAGAVIDIYERQVTRCKAPPDRLRALGRAAQVAAEHDALDRSRQFFDIALGGGVQEDTLVVLEDVARDSDGERQDRRLSRTLAEAMAAGGQGSRDGGRTRGMLLGRAAELAYRELKDVDKAFVWVGDAVVTHVDDERLDQLDHLADEVGDPKRADAVLTRALEEVFDGPLVRKLLARRADVRRAKLDDKKGAAVDLKKLHDLSPSDTGVMDQLSSLYTELEDYRGMVQLYEDQILRGKDQGIRAELARKVARLWEERLGDSREAADAWRRVLRMKSGDPEATEGLERAKANMLKRAKSEPPPPMEAPPVAAPAPAPPVATPARAPSVKPPVDMASSNVVPAIDMDDDEDNAEDLTSPEMPGFSDLADDPTQTAAPHFEELARPASNLPPPASRPTSTPLPAPMRGSRPPMPLPPAAPGRAPVASSRPPPTSNRPPPAASRPPAPPAPPARPSERPRLALADETGEDDELLVDDDDFKDD